jgi:hypothetical protein
LTFLFGFIKLKSNQINSTQGLVRRKGGRAISVGWEGSSSVDARFIPSERCIGKMKR